MRHLLSITDLSVDEIDALLETASDIEANPDKYAHVMEGKKLATLFFEPSTRTRLSFEAAMYELGGHVIGFAGASNSSAAKGESVKDTPSSHPDPGRPDDPEKGEGAAGSFEGGPVRRPAFWAHGAFPHRRAEPLSRQ